MKFNAFIPPPATSLFFGLQDWQTRNNESPPRHADILGWPKEKDAQKLIAQELAAESTLVLRTLE